jgi:hypothetical protein
MDKKTPYAHAGPTSIFVELRRAYFPTSLKLRRTGAFFNANPLKRLPCHTPFDTKTAFSTQDERKDAFTPEPCRGVAEAEAPDKRSRILLLDVPPYFASACAASFEGHTSLSAYKSII